MADEEITRQRVGGQTFKRLRSSGRVYEGLDLDRVKFDGCVLAQHDDPRLGLVVRDVTAVKMSVADCSLHGVRFEELRVDGLAATRLHHLAACVFRHVTLRGRIGPIMTTPAHYALPDETRAAFNSAIVAYYQDVDWALDISAAEFSDADFYLVPGDLVRRDPATQFLIRRDAVAKTKNIELPAYAQISISRFEESPFDSLVAIAPKRSKNFARHLADLQFLRQEGLAE